MVLRKLKRLMYQYDQRCVVIPDLPNFNLNTLRSLYGDSHGEVHRRSVSNPASPKKSQRREVTEE